MNRLLAVSSKDFFVSSALIYPLKKAGNYLILFLISIISVGVLYILLMIAPVNMVRTFVVLPPRPQMKNSQDAPTDYQALVDERLQKAQKKLDSYTPVRPYLIVNTTANTFHLYKGTEMVREGRCSTGSYVKLKGKDREWMFKTPKGYQTIKGKTVDPVWKKPDWAFVEEGLKVPSPNHQSRFEYGVLGDYALYMGDGYMIHGTLYQRLLGLPVTHGCIRLGDDDLEAVYKTLTPNSKVFII